MQINTNASSRNQGLGSFLSFNILLSTTLALFLLGLCGILILQTRRLGQLIQQNAELQVYLQRTLPPERVHQLKATIQKMPFLAAETNQEPALRFISRKQAARDYAASSGEDFEKVLGYNPLRDAYVLKIRPAYLQPDSLRRIKTRLESLGGVYEVDYVENLLNQVYKNVRIIIFLLLLFGLFILFTVVLLIDNTLKIALFSQRLLIRSMQLIGATDYFIQKPFLIQSLIQGASSGLLAALLIMGFLRYIHTQIPEMLALYEFDKVLLLGALMILLGSLISLLSTYRSVRRYLYISLDDLH
ncbi:MAG: permease-like cell division protein FtsX [Microscillaceae bacterium]